MENSRTEISYGLRETYLIMAKIVKYIEMKDLISQLDVVYHC